MNNNSIILNEQWRPHIGDPTAIGWVITIAYFLTFILCLWAGIAAQKHEKRGLLIGIALLLLLLGFNKQLDLQTLLTIIGRHVAKEQGWYYIRRSVQFLFVVLFTLIVLFSLIMWARWMKRRWRQYGLHFSGTVLILLFIIIRAASIEHVSLKLTTQNNSGLHMIISLFELGGILIVGLGSVLCLHRINVSKHRDFKFDWE